MIETWAGHKRFKPKDNKDGDGEDFHDTKHKNDTHEGRTDPDRRLYRKSEGKESKLCYIGYALMENRHGLVVTGIVTRATGRAERAASEEVLERKASGNKKTPKSGVKKLPAPRSSPQKNSKIFKNGGSSAVC